MTCDCQDTDCSTPSELPPRALGAHAQQLFDYLELRAEAAKWPEAIDDPDVVEELLAQARAARRSFRLLATPALRAFRLKEGRRQIDPMVDAVMKQVGQGGPLVELVHKAVQAKEVQAILKREGVSERRLEKVYGELKAADLTLRAKGGDAILEGPLGVRHLRRAKRFPKGIPGPSLLRNLGRSWSTQGRGLAGPIVPPGNPRWAKEVAWNDGFAHALVNGAWFFDRDVRDLEDRCGLPAAQGADGGAGAIIGAVLLIAGVVLMLIASCVDDPGVSELLFVLGAVLSVAGIGVLVGSGVPVEACAPDPTTGAMTCARI